MTEENQYLAYRTDANQNIKHELSRNIFVPLIYSPLGTLQSSERAKNQIKNVLGF